jgi:phosphomannomutase/phosphoglucomutase
MSCFREYDIRGVYGDDITEDFAGALGRAFGTQIRDEGGTIISIGYDVRLSSPSLRSALLTGLLSTGLNVVDIGACTTPVLYFSLFQLKVNGGIMITASHNPAEYNGFKLCKGKTTIYGDDIQRIKNDIAQKMFRQGKGEVTFEKDFLSVYLKYFTDHFGSFRGKKVVMDCGNGAGALIAPEIFKALGCDLIPLYCEPDGRFPNHHPDPTVPENLADLIATVRKEGADLGVAFDGDADRLGAVDETGEIIWGDKLTLLFATEILKKQSGATIISEVKASQVLYDEIARQGGNGIMWKAGHSLIKAKMKETGALLAGEMSGHIFFADRFFGFDDAIYAGCRLVEILTQGNRTLSSYFEGFPKTHATPEIRVDCPDDRKFDIVKRCQERLQEEFKIIDVDGVRFLFDGGWGLVRASNTQPSLVLRFEADQLPRIEEMEQKIRLMVAEALNE